MQRMMGLIARFGRDESGVFAVIFGLMAIVLIAMGGAVVDYVALEQSRNRAQVALDAAALALQPEIMEPTYDRQLIWDQAEALMVDRIGAEWDVEASITDVQIDTEVGSLRLTASMTMPTIFVGLVGVPQLGASIQAEATRGAMDIEVAVAVDITGSMNDPVTTEDEDDVEQSKVAALRTALAELIDIVVQDQQEPTYSKMAIVPYSMAVNVGSTYAEAIRGAVTEPTAVTGLGWAASTAKSISGATRANPVVITANNHGFVTGDYVYINGVEGMTQINNRIFQVTRVNASSFRLNAINGTGYSWYSRNGTATKCSVSTCEIVVISPNHGLESGERAYIWGTGGTSSINNSSSQSGSNLFWTIGTATTNTFVLPGTPRTNGRNYGSYTSGGQVSCLTYDCQYYAFENRYGSWRRHPVSTCVTERNPNGFNDQPTSVTLLGRNFPSSGNNCLTNTIVPLTDDKVALHDIADGLVAGGSTAGHVGVAWAWYLLSPLFNGPWPADSQPAPETEANVVKAVVLMTDGEFNSVYCNGVIAQNSTSGSGDTNTHIGCNAPNGSSYTQTETLCTAMKDAGIRVYTVGFAIVNSENARNLMRNCATDPSHAHEATTGQDLIDVFRAIGLNLAQLRITR